MKKNVSLKDVALEAGVSTATVSYVLNNKGEQEKISKAVSKKILSAARRLNYRPNQIARSLKSGVTHTIGLIIEDISNPFFANLASFIEKELQSLGYTVIIGCHYENMTQSKTLLQTLMLRQVDGIILTPMDRSEMQVKELKRSGIPYVLVDRYFANVPSNTVTINNFEISRKAVTHLFERGYKRIGMLAFDSSFEHMNDRVLGYQQALKEHKKNPDLLLQRISFSHAENDIRLAIENLLSNRNKADSLFFANNILAMRSIAVLNKLGIRVPDELGLVSFDARDAFDYFYSPITYVEQNLKELGERAVTMLLNNIRTRSKKIVNIVVDAKLVIRASSGEIKN